MCTGLREELFTRHGIAGHSIHTTSVHPSWHSTGLVKPVEPQLNKLGIYADPASNVSRLVVAQVLAARSGRIFVPKDQERYANARAWPLWFRDVTMGYPWSKKWEREQLGFVRELPTGGQVEESAVVV